MRRLTNPIGVRLFGGLAGSLELEVQKDWFSWLKEAGFDAVDVMALTGEVKAELDRLGLALGSFDVSGVPALFAREAAKREEAAAHVRRQLADAAALGGRICFMCLVPEDKTMPRQESFDLFRETFPAIVADAEQLGITIVLEGWPGPAPHYPTLGCTPETLRAMFREIPSPAFGLNYDPSHLVRLGIDHIRFLREFAGRIAHVHGKDCVFLDEDVYLYGRGQAAAFGQPVKYSEGPWRYAIPGEGTVNWAAVAFELERFGYQGAVSIELEDHRYRETVEDRRRGLLRAQSHLRAYFS